MAARHAKTVLAFGRREPVADIVIRVGAETSRPAFAHQRRPGLAACRLKRGHDFELRDVAKPMAASPARSILEVNDVVANLAAK